jgi:hypothetical protein
MDVVCPLCGRIPPSKYENVLRKERVLREEKLLKRLHTSLLLCASTHLESCHVADLTVS